MTNRITPKSITELKDDEIFCFGANLSGIHGLGAAKTALKWGAKYGQGEGMQGSTYAIPTKDGKIKTLPLESIKIFVDDFIEFAREHIEYTFLVTPIGTGLAGLSVKEMAPLFRDALELENVYLPKVFLDELK